MKKKMIVADQILIGNTLKKNMAVIYDSHILSIHKLSELINDTSEIGDVGLKHINFENVTFNKMDGFSIDEMDVQIFETGTVSPGFVDVHIHGSAGADVMDGTEEALEIISKALVERGVTSYLGTSVSHNAETLYHSADVIRQKMLKEAEVQNHGARLLGMHLEGPFLNPINAGAHDKQYLRHPSTAFVLPILDVLKLITLAPELDEDFQFIQWLKVAAPHIKLSMGHSDATYDLAMGAIDKGIDSVTHLFNAMRGLHHREPGVVGAALDSDVFAEIISDGIHIHDAAIRTAYKCKGDNRLLLVTDAMCAACMKPGQYKLGDLTVTTDGDSARLSDGTLAGSVLTLDQAVKNMHQRVGVSLEAALKMASVVPADLLKNHKVGQIAIDRYADFVVLDKNLDVETTIVGGTVIYRRNDDADYR